MRIALLAGAGIACTTMVFVPTARADPGYSQDVRILTPPGMRCEVSGPRNLGYPAPASVYCQGLFADAPADPCPQAPGQNCAVFPLHQDQAYVKDTGEFGYQDGNLGLVQPDIINAVAGQTYHVQGWTVVQSPDSATFTNDATGHGMTITVDKFPGRLSLSDTEGHPQADVTPF
jgi:hypothetical protein